MKKFQLLITSLLVLALLAGCGGASSGGMDKNAAADAPAAEAPAEEYYGDTEMSESVGTGELSATQPANQKMIRTVYLDAETENLDALLGNLNQQLAAVGGYIENRELYSNGSDDGQWRQAALMLRVPADQADMFLQDVEKTANVTSFNEDLEDVTLQYAATEDRLQALETEQARLLELMEQAETMTDLLEVEARLTDVRFELETIASQKRLLDNQINYTTIHLNVWQVTKYTPVRERTVWERITSGFSDNLEDLGDTLVDIFVWLVVSSPVLVILAIPVVLVILLVRRHSKKKKVKKAPRQDEAPKE